MTLVVYWPKLDRITMHPLPASADDIHVFGCVCDIYGCVILGEL